MEDREHHLGKRAFVFQRCILTALLRSVCAALSKIHVLIGSLTFVSSRQSEKCLVQACKGIAYGIPEAAQ